MKILFNIVSQKAARLAVLFAFVVVLVPAAFAQAHEDQQVTEPVAAVEKPKTPAVPGALVPAVNDLKGISLGMTANEVKKTLGDPDTADATGMYFELKNGESLQLRLNAEKKVSMIAAMYTGKNAKAPEFTAVFGPDVKIEPGENGRLYKLVRYPASGYWVAYSRINSGDSAMTTVTMTKMN
ncbi:MAG: hypothetical protein ABI791_09170 [Acidobacteriota bacterium]